MKIDWVSLLGVAIVSVVATAVFVLLLSISIRSFSGARTVAGQEEVPLRNRLLGWSALVMIAALLLLALYLIIPQFH